MPARAANHPELAVTDQHRRAAFQAMAWVGWTYEQAMADPVRSRLVNLRARQMCNAQARAPRRIVVEPTPQQARHALLLRAGLYLLRPLPATDLKRAASGDRDED